MPDGDKGCTLCDNVWVCVSDFQKREISANKNKNSKNIWGYTIGKCVEQILVRRVRVIIKIDFYGAEKH